MTDTDATSVEGAPTLPGLDPHSTARHEVKRIMETEKRPATFVAKQVNVQQSTFAAWLSGTYAGNNDRILESVRAWLDSRKASARTLAVMRRAPDFIETPSSEACISALEHAQHAPDIVVVSGPPGVGKTQACEIYCKRASSVWMITAEPLWSTSTCMLVDSLLEEIGLTERMTRHQSSRAIVRRVSNTNGLILIDEAQHLSTRAMDQLRTIHDKAKIGVALVGNETVHARLEGHARDIEFAQLFSRVGLRVKLGGAKTTDINMLLDAWGVDGKQERTLLKEIAKRPGALRGMSKTLRLAFMRAGVESRDAISDADITAAWRSISNSEISKAA